MKRIHKIVLAILIAIAYILIPSSTTHSSVAVAPEVAKPIEDMRAKKIDEYFASKKMALAGTGVIFVAAADKANIDWRLLAAISVKESTGGNRMIQGSYNAFGWGSGTLKFKSYQESIPYISDKLGNGKYYAGKSTADKLKTYNPPSVEPGYSQSVINIMQSIMVL